MPDVWSQYSKKVMDHFKNPRNVGEIENPDGVGHVGNPVCGDIMELYIKVNDGIIVDMNDRTMQIQAESGDLLELEIFNLQGQRFLRQQVESGKNADIRFLPEGIYAAVLKRPGGQISTHRFALP